VHVYLLLQGKAGHMSACTCISCTKLWLQGKEKVIQSSLMVGFGNSVQHSCAAKQCNGTQVCECKAKERIVKWYTVA
jgi:hypothetical protein